MHRKWSPSSQANEAISIHIANRDKNEERINEPTLCFMLMPAVIIIRVIAINVLLLAVFCHRVP